MLTPSFSTARHSDQDDRIKMEKHSLVVLIVQCLWMQKMAVDEIRSYLWTTSGHQGRDV